VKHLSGLLLRKVSWVALLCKFAEKLKRKLHYQEAPLVAGKIKH
jgi:hypothetical protein